ncbi:MAG TPA: molybdenum cofactor guanylyltransferase [bacterium]|nr:molybdenum cofactor guanylyltransferase [bacterium]HOM27191.1 molybdenum cofactor guanylyltransferase [bacterium]
MNSIILAKGEKSKRTGLDKALIEINSKKLIEIIIERIKPVFDKIYIVSLNPEKFENYKDEKIDVIKDGFGCGPLGGIYTGLSISSSLYNFVFACDMPFINVDFVRYMMGIKKNYDVLVPVYKNRYEVLFAIYSKNVLKVMEEMIKRGEYRVREILNRAKVEYISQDIIEKFGWQESFFNLNTKNDILILKHGKFNKF